MAWFTAEKEGMQTSREEMNSGQLSSHGGVFVIEGAKLALNIE